MHGIFAHEQPTFQMNIALISGRANIREPKATPPLFRSEDRKNGSRWRTRGGGEKRLSPLVTTSQDSPGNNRFLLFNIGKLRNQFIDVLKNKHGVNAVHDTVRIHVAGDFLDLGGLRDARIKLRNQNGIIAFDPAV